MSSIYWPLLFLGIVVLTNPAFAEFRKPLATIYKPPTPVHTPPEVEKPKPPTLPPIIARPPKPNVKPLPPIIVRPPLPPIIAPLPMRPPPLHKKPPPYGHYPAYPPLENEEIPYKPPQKVTPPPI
ncbi:hypothetical protein SO802_032613 [Lithocarpus litseifolius]|uniref:Uncharacterized protein n=1 Tax=Lithocarpus litseifolius TaxID=425828 RepID=A0AAW2BCG7_9ROSI